MVVDAKTLAVVNENLKASMREHLVWRASSGPRIRKEAMERAYVLRRNAHAMDPDHTASGWAEEQSTGGARGLGTPKGRDTHEELTAFYREQLGREWMLEPPPPPPSMAAQPKLRSKVKKSVRRKLALRRAA